MVRLNHARLRNIRKVSTEMKIYGYDIAHSNKELSLSTVPSRSVFVPVVISGRKDWRPVGRSLCVFASSVVKMVTHRQMFG